MKENLISGKTEEEVLSQIESNFAIDPAPLEYAAIIDLDGTVVKLDIDIDPGGGFESGFATTTLLSELLHGTDFSFAIHPKEWTDAIGKFFGMQDVVIGFENFDEKFIIKTNDEKQVQQLFSDQSVREALMQLPTFTLGITKHHTDHHAKERFLELNIEEGITEVSELKSLYRCFVTLLRRLPSN